MRRLIAGGLATALALFSTSAGAAEPSPEDDTGGYVGPLAAGLGLVVVGGGMSVLILAEDDDVTIGGTLIGAAGIAGMMAGTAIWMMDDLTEAEAEDKIRQGGVALTTMGTGSAALGGLMVLSSFVRASDVSSTTRVAGIVAGSAGGAAVLSGVIMYALGGAPPTADQAWVPRVEVGAGDAQVMVRF